jgi:hypothetical protein
VEKMVDRNLEQRTGLGRIRQLQTESRLAVAKPGVGPEPSKRIRPRAGVEVPHYHPRTLVGGGPKAGELELKTATLGLVVRKRSQGMNPEHGHT